MNRKRARVKLGLAALVLAAFAPLLSRDARAADTPLPACTGEVQTLVQALLAWSQHFHASQDRAYSDHRCSDPAVLCLDRFGRNTRDTIPSRVLAGQSLDVSVLFPAIDSATIALSAAVRASSALATGNDVLSKSSKSSSQADLRCHPSAADVSALQVAVAPIAELGAQPGLEGLDVPRDTPNGDAMVAAWGAWIDGHRARGFEYASLDAKLDVRYGDDVVTVDFSRTERGDRTPSAVVHHAITVDNGRYHLELSVLVPVVFHGERRATLTPAANATELRVGIESDWHVTGAIMLDLFPFGRQKGELTSFRECRHRSCFENWLGLQFGTGFDHPARDWYAGLVFEPVSGLALGAGVAFLKGDFLGPGLAEGMLLPSARALSVDSHYMARPYLGLVVTTDIFHVIDRGSLSTHELR